MNNFENSIKISDDFFNLRNNLFTSTIIECNELILNFATYYKEEKSKLPYHINVIDALRAIENAHSRILVKLFKYKLNGEYVILSSFLEFFSNEYPNFKFTHRIIKPIIEQEKKRIDASIVDNDYAIIIENKINNATDIRGQIDKYLTRINRKDLYVIYLTRTGGSPPDQSFSQSKKKDISAKKRYLEISFLNDILPWLETIVLPFIPKNEDFLKSSLEQYIDHLKGLFNLRKMNRIMDEKLINHLENLLKLDNNYESNIEVLKEKISYLSLTKSYLSQLYHKQQTLIWSKKIKEDFLSMGFEPIVDYENKYKHAGVNFVIHDVGDCSVLMRIDPDGNCYFGVSKYFSNTDSKKDKINEFVKNNHVTRNNIEENKNWYFKSFASSYSRTYELFKQQVFVMIEGVNKINFKNT